MTAGRWIRWALWASLFTVVGSAVVAALAIGALSLIDRPQQVGFGVGYGVLGGVIGALVGVALAGAGSVAGVLIGSISAALGVRRLPWIAAGAFAVAAAVVGALLAPTFPLPTFPSALVCALVGAAAAAISFQHVARELSAGNSPADGSETPPRNSRGA